MPLTMMQKRSDFQSLIQGLLALHDAAFTAQRVDTTERIELEQTVDRKTRVKITGNPERYCVIRDLGQVAINAPAAFDAAGNVDCFIGHRVDVRIFWGKDYEGSQDDFESAIYNDRSSTLPGLLDSIRATRVRSVSSDTYHIGPFGGDAFTSVIRGTWDFGPLGGKPELCHYLQFETILIG